MPRCICNQITASVEGPTYRSRTISSWCEMECHNWSSYLRCTCIRYLPHYEDRQRGMLWALQSPQSQCSSSYHSNNCTSNCTPTGMNRSMEHCWPNGSHCLHIPNIVSLFYYPDIILELTVVLSRATLCKDFVMPSIRPMQPLCICEWKLRLLFTLMFSVQRPELHLSRKSLFQG